MEIGQEIGKKSAFSRAWKYITDWDVDVKNGTSTFFLLFSILPNFFYPSVRVAVEKSGFSWHCYPNDR